MSLDQIKLDDTATIIKINQTSSMKRRLLDLGFIPGEKVKCVLISPFYNPKAYQINGNLIALRDEDARNVMVEYERN